MKNHKDKISLIVELEAKIDELEAAWENAANLSNLQGLRITGLQSRVDELMLEFCPEDMTKAQLDNWALHQRAFP